MRYFLSYIMVIFYVFLVLIVRQYFLSLESAGHSVIFFGINMHILYLILILFALFSIVWLEKKYESLKGELNDFKRN